LEKLHYDQQDGKAFYHSTYNPYLGENLKVWDALDFLALATSFIPPQGVRPAIMLRIDLCGVGPANVEKTGAPGPDCST
jgi:hypothetical protein